MLSNVVHFCDEARVLGTSVEALSTLSKAVMRYLLDLQVDLRGGLENSKRMSPLRRFTNPLVQSGMKRIDGSSCTLQHPTTTVISLYRVTQGKLVWYRRRGVCWMREQLGHSEPSGDLRLRIIDYKTLALQTPYYKQEAIASPSRAKQVRTSNYHKSTILLQSQVYPRDCGATAAAAASTKVHLHLHAFVCLL